VVGQDERAGRAQHQAFARRDAARLEHRDFLHQRRWRHHHAVTDEAFDVVVQNA